MNINFKKYNADLPVFIPEYKSIGAAGLDLYSSSIEKIIIKHFETKIIPTNLIIEIPNGWEGQIRPRSGIALKYGITIMNSPGTIDSDYRGEVKILLINFGKKEFEVNLGDRIAQLIISKYEKVNFVLSEEISVTERGDGGYGSTGLNG